MKKRMSFLLAALMLLSATACGQTAAPAEIQTPAAPSAEIQAPAAAPVEALEPEKVLVDEAGIALTIDSPAWELSKDGTYYQLTGVRYCTNVVEEQYQSMNIYIPAAYIDGGEVCGYTAETAPVVLQNNNAGWRSGKAGEVDKSYIENGFVFVNAGSRSRDAGAHGKAPSAVVDLKSAVRTLRLNAAVIPGDMDRIFSVGASGAGEMSSVLGASGNMSEYYGYLYENGAPGLIMDGSEYISTISDAVYGCMCYCPIADIENADLAYAWMHFDDGATGVVPMFGAAKDFSPFQLALQNDLADAYVEYINALGLEDADGEILGLTGPREGSLYDAVLGNMSDALNALITASTDENGDFRISGPGKGMGPNAKPGEEFDSLSAYIASIDPGGAWLANLGDGTYSVMDMAGFINGTGLVRNKDIPGFDTFDMSAENDAFGKPEESAVHYSASVAAVLQENFDRYAEMEGFDKDAVDSYIAEAGREDIARQTYLMNATAILLNVAKGEQEAEPAQFWRTRNGTADEHTSFTVAYALCMAAKMCGFDVDYSLVWNMTHGSNEGTSTGTFTDWVHSICGSA